MKTSASVTKRAKFYAPARQEKTAVASSAIPVTISTPASKSPAGAMSWCVLACVFAACYGATIASLASDWWSDPDYSF
jgi:hypothetical protein